MSELSTFEAEILLFIVDRRHVSVLDVINAFDPQVRCRETEELLKTLARSGFIRIDWNRICHALPEASHALSMYKDAYNQKADENAKKEIEAMQQRMNDREKRKHDFLVAIISALVGSVAGAINGAFLTLYLEHGREIVAVIIKLLSK